MCEAARESSVIRWNSQQSLPSCRGGNSWPPSFPTITFSKCQDNRHVNHEQNLIRNDTPCSRRTPSIQPRGGHKVPFLQLKRARTSRPSSFRLSRPLFINWQSAIGFTPPPKYRRY